MVKASDNEKVVKKDVSAEKKKKKQKKKEKKLQRHGVVYIKHIPHGFYEDEMKGFFSQFGKVLRVCVARSAKTGNSRGYGYIQFADHDVAKIAAETMNNYLMFEKIVKCSLLPPELVTLATFANARRRPGVHCPGQDATVKVIQQLNNSGGKEQMRRSRKRRAMAHRRTLAKLAELGVQYDIEGGIVQVGTAKPDTDASPKLEEESEEPEVMTIDPDDDEITFKTPPNTVKRLAEPQDADGACSAGASPILTSINKSATKLKASSVKKLAAGEASAKKSARKATSTTKAAVNGASATNPSTKKLTPTKNSSTPVSSPAQIKSTKKGKQKPLPVKVSPAKIRNSTGPPKHGGSAGKLPAKKFTPARSPRTLALSSGKKRLK